MQWNPIGFTLIAVLSLAAGSFPALHGAHAACEAGEKIDGSTVADARKKMEGAGYQKIRDLKKGCDNYWHAKAEKDGKPVFVVLSPQGEVLQESD